MAHDYSEHVAQPTEEQFKELNELCQKLSNEEKEIQRLEQELKTAKMRRQDIAERQMPEKMEAMGLEEFTTTSGLRVKVKEHVHAHIAKDRYPQAVRWLEDHGHAGLVKRMIVVSFGKEQEDDARRLLGSLEMQYDNVGEQMKVEPSTLRAWVKEQLENGAPVDQELFGVHIRKEARVD